MRRTHHICCFAWAIILLCSLRLAADGPKQLFSLTIAAPKEPIKAGTEVRLLVTVKNTSNRTISFVVSPGLVPEDGLLYRINARDAKGQQAPPSAAIRNRDKRVSAQYFISRTARTLRPGAFFVDQVTITDFYDLSEPGNYTISLAREIPVHQKLGKGSVKSNDVTVTIVL